MNACRNGQKSVVGIFLKKGGIDLSKRDAGGNTPLHYAAEKGYRDIVRMLLDNGADPTIPNNKGDTPLHAASLSGNKEILRILIDSGADINAQDNDGLTPLMILLGRLCCAALSSRFNKIIMLIVMAVMMMASFILMMSSSSTILIVAGLLGLGFFMSGVYPTTLSTMDSRYNGSTIATGVCISTATVGGVLLPIIIGQVAEVSGIAGGIATIFFAMVFMLAFMLLKFIRFKKGIV